MRKTPIQRRILITVILLGLMGILIPATLTVADSSRQVPEVYAEALGTANLRSGPGTDFGVVGEISAGTEYRVLRQHALVPWMLLEVPALPSGGGWVFNELIQIKRGNLAEVPYVESYDEIPATGLGTSSQPDTQTQTQDQTQSITAPPTPTDATASDVPTADIVVSTPTATVFAPPANIVTARLLGRSNIRYAPGIEYPTIVTLDEGAVLTVLAQHSGLPWYKVAVEGSPTGSGWVNEGVVEIQGDLSTVEVISDFAFDFPTPSATPNTVVVSTSPFQDFGSGGTNLASTLGLQLHNYLLSKGLAPRTDREGSIFVMDLQTGEHFTLNGGVAYSGMSINKIPVLVSYFIEQDRPLETQDAELVANTMICSENTATNQLMTEVGEGNILEGGQRISHYMQQLGLGNSFVVAPFFTGNPDATPAPVSSIQTSVDQQRTQPDAFNQFTVEEIGWLLGTMYQCAADGTGPLTETFPDQINQLECRQMLRVMSANKIGALIEAGIPSGTTLAHKHGWIADTHGDAGLIFGPEKSYVLAMVYHERTDWLDYEQSFPVLEEIARQTWNFFNPDYTLDAIHPTSVPATCNIYAEPVISDMLNGIVDIPALTLASQSTQVETPEVTPTLTPSPTVAP